MRRGKLIGVGVGPGDPDLLTLKAVRVLEKAQVVAFIAAAGRGSRAREIAARHIPSSARELAAVMPMSGDSEATMRAYAQLATGIVGELGRGVDVVYLCEGDPLLYGSFAHLVERLRARFECEAIPGISAMSAAAAACLQPLAVREQPVAILPATIPQRRLEGLLKEAENAVILKVGRRLGQVRQALAAARMLRGAILVENVSTDQQRIRRIEEAGDEAPYFSLILAGRDRRQP